MSGRKNKRRKIIRWGLWAVLPEGKKGTRIGGCDEKGCKVSVRSKDRKKERKTERIQGRKNRMG